MEQMEKTNIIMVLVLALLIVMSGVQAVTLNNVKGTIEESQSGISTSKTISSSNNNPKTTNNLPSSIKDLPEMVGGC